MQNTTLTAANSRVTAQCEALLTGSQHSATLVNCTLKHFYLFIYLRVYLLNLHNTQYRGVLKIVILEVMGVDLISHKW